MFERILAAGCLAAWIIAAGNGCCCRGPMRGDLYAHRQAAAPCDACGGGGCHECRMPCFKRPRFPKKFCGSGCGEIYWDEWHSDPPSCDPCDDCGNWIGHQGLSWRRCGWRSLFGCRDYWSDCEPGCGCGHHHAGHYGDVTYGDEIYDGEVFDERQYMQARPVPASPFKAEPQPAPGEPRSALKKSAASTQPQRPQYVAPPVHRTAALRQAR
jgi:hypothetical protein